jgi:hypothetical protein
MQKNIAGLHGTRFGTTTMEARLRTVTVLPKHRKMHTGSIAMPESPSESPIVDTGTAELGDELDDDRSSNSDSKADDDSDCE